jgi:hypothetical protein
MIRHVLLTAATPLFWTAKCSPDTPTVFDASERPLILEGRETAMLLAQTSVADNTTYDSSVKVNSGWVPKNDANDWLFHVHTRECDQSVTFDISQDSFIARTTLPFLLAVCIGFVVSRGKTVQWVDTTQGASVPDIIITPDVEEGDATSAEASSRSPKRLFHLDYARITAVMCVIFEHTGGMGYTRRNVGWGLWWALPFLLMTTGMARVMSKSSVMGYQLRLLVLLVVGTSFNWVADLITHRDWQHDFANTIFQMFYIVVIMIMHLLSIPLCQELLVLRERRDLPVSMYNTIATAIFGFIAVVANILVLLNTPISVFTKMDGDFGRYYNRFNEHLHIFLAEFFGAWFLVSLVCFIRVPHRYTSVLGWLLLLYIFVPAVLSPMHQQSFAVWGNLYLFAMVTYIWPLRGSDVIARITQAYWPLFFMLLCLIAMPDMTGRCDMFPPGTVWERFRHAAGQCLLAIVFVAGGFKIDEDPYGVTNWLGWWSLFAYISHVAWFRLFGSPYGAVITFSLMVPFYGAHKWTASKRKRSTRQVVDESNGNRDELSLTDVRNSER